MPTCGLALTESERALPGVLDELEAELGALGLGGLDAHVRMTGCPNGCSRPYTAEIGFVGGLPGRERCATEYLLARGWVPSWLGRPSMRSTRSKSRAGHAPAPMAAVVATSLRKARDRATATATLVSVDACRSASIPLPALRGREAIRTPAVPARTATRVPAGGTRRRRLDVAAVSRSRSSRSRLNSPSLIAGEGPGSH